MEEELQPLAAAAAAAPVIGSSSPKQEETGREDSKEKIRMITLSRKVLKYAQMNPIRLDEKRSEVQIIKRCKSVYFSQEK